MDMKKLLGALGFKTQRELVAAMGLQESAASHWKTRLGDAAKLRLIDFAAQRGVAREALGLDE